MDMMHTHYEEGEQAIEPLLIYNDKGFTKASITKGKPYIKRYVRNRGAAMNHKSTINRHFHVKHLSGGEYVILVLLAKRRGVNRYGTGEPKPFAKNMHRLIDFGYITKDIELTEEFLNSDEYKDGLWYVEQKESELAWERRKNSEAKRKVRLLIDKLMTEVKADMKLAFPSGNINIVRPSMKSYGELSCHFRSAPFMIRMTPDLELTPDNELAYMDIGLTISYASLGGGNLDNWTLEDAQRLVIAKKMIDYLPENPVMKHCLSIVERLEALPEDKNIPVEEL